MNEILLDYDQSVFSIEFSALNYTNPEKNQYKYKLEGFDIDWSITNSDQRIVTYTNLDPGDYIFKGRLNNYLVLRKLYRGKIVTRKVTFPEGSRARKIASILFEHLGTDSVRFMDYTNDSVFILESIPDKPKYNF